MFFGHVPATKQTEVVPKIKPSVNAIHIYLPFGTPHVAAVSRTL